jgi:hypothetical protein
MQVASIFSCRYFSITSGREPRTDDVPCHRTELELGKRAGHVKS